MKEFKWREIQGGKKLNVLSVLVHLTLFYVSLSMVKVCEGRTATMDLARISSKNLTGIILTAEFSNIESNEIDPVDPTDPSETVEPESAVLPDWVLPSDCPTVSRIIGGSVIPSSDIYKFPWVVSILNERGHSCGGNFKYCIVNYHTL